MVTSGRALVSLSQCLFDGGGLDSGESCCGDGDVIMIAVGLLAAAVVGICGGCVLDGGFIVVAVWMTMVEVVVIVMVVMSLLVGMVM